MHDSAMNDSTSQHYLVIRPLAEDPSLVEPHLETLSAATGLDTRTLRQRLIGTALRVLKVHHDRAALEEMSRKLEDAGLIASTVISKNELGGIKKPFRCTCLEISSKSITFLSPHSEERFSLDDSGRCLLVLATMNFKKLQGKRMARLAMNAGSQVPLPETLSSIFRNQPVMDIYIDGVCVPIRIDSTKFNYSCLGEANKKVAACNFPTIMKEIGRVCPSVILDAGFGEAALPFLDLSGEPPEEELFREFSLYSGFVFLARQKGLFAASPANHSGNGIVSDVSLMENIKIEDMNGMIWAGPLLHPVKTQNKKELTPGGSFVGQQEISQLPPPPEGMAVSGSRAGLSIIPGLNSSLARDIRWVKSLGPPFFVYPLSLLAIISFGLAYSTRMPEPLSLAFLSLGLILFIHSFVLLQRKKTIENCPTSRIRSMPMGHVEIKGYARQKYSLKSPYTFTDCVYYSYKIYKKVWRKGEQRYELKECGNSGPVPFYLEDETGKALIVPDKAIIHAGITQSVLGDPLVKIFGGSQAIAGEEKKIVETVIPVKQFLYVIGFAQRLKISSQEKRKRLTEKLRTLKMDQDRLKKYDLDHDGTISQEEWDLAREKAEEDVMLEELSSKNYNDRVAVGEHPSGGLFYISDEKEEWILKSMSWKIPLFLILSLASISGGAFYLLKFFQNKTLLLALKKLLWY